MVTYVVLGAGQFGQLQVITLVSTRILKSSLPACNAVYSQDVLLKTAIRVDGYDWEGRLRDWSQVRANYSENHFSWLKVTPLPLATELAIPQLSISLCAVQLYISVPEMKRRHSMQSSLLKRRLPPNMQKLGSPRRHQGR